MERDRQKNGNSQPARVCRDFQRREQAPDRPNASEEEDDGNEFAGLVETHAGQIMPPRDEPLVKGHFHWNPPGLAQNRGDVVEENTRFPNHVVSGNRRLRLAEGMEVQQWFVPLARQGPNSAEQDNSKKGLWKN